MLSPSTPRIYTKPIHPAFFVCDSCEEQLTLFSNTLKTINPNAIVVTSSSSWELCGQLNIIQASMIFLNVEPENIAAITVLAVRQIPYCKTIPIVAYSPAMGEASERQILEWGADLFFAQPTAERTFRSGLKRMIERAATPDEKQKV